ncbi:MAG: hypothetical protein L0H94_09090 [Nitrospira sp.]|nr:hypothetical protein [Nitrospira sp.]
MYRYGVSILVIVTTLSAGCGPLETHENRVGQSVEPSQGTGEVKEPKGVVPRPNIQSHHARFYHESQRSRLSIRYRNTGPNPAYHVRTDLAVFLDGNSVPIETDTYTLSTLAPNRSLELRGILTDAFFENVLNGKATFVMEFTARYQNEEGQEYEAVSVWQFSRSTMEFFPLEERAN